jgi:hypothetical protein
MAGAAAFSYSRMRGLMGGGRRSGSKPVGMHSLQKILCDWVARCPSDYRVDWTVRAHGSLALVNPFDNLVWNKDGHAIEASTNLALHQFGPIHSAMFVRENVVVIFATELR